MRLDIQFTFAEFARSRRTLLTKTYIRPIDPLICIGLLCWGLYQLMRGTAMWLDYLFIGIAFVYFGLVGFSLFVMPAIMFRRDAKLRQVFVLTIEEAQITLESGGERREFRWSEYHKALNTKDYYFLIYGTKTVHTIPKRVFADQTEADVFESLVKSKLSLVE